MSSFKKVSVFLKNICILERFLYSNANKSTTRMNTKLSILFIVLLSITACTLFSGGNKQKVVLPQEINQWAVTAKASSAFGGISGQNKDDQSPYAATGEPDVKVCDDDTHAWMAESENDGLQWLELNYPQVVFVSKINIRESYNPGAVVRVELLNKSDEDYPYYVTVWESKDRNKLCPGSLALNLEQKEGNITMLMSSFKTDTVRITINTDIEGFHEIDAVELIGYAQKWYYYNNTLFIE